MRRVILFFHKRFFYFLAGFIGGILLMILLIRAFNFHDSTIISSYTPSPSKEYVAINYINMGGGAAGYCYSYVALVPKWHPYGFNKAVYKVLGDRCNANIVVTWKDNNTLIVNGVAYPFETNTSNSDGKVKIIFE